MMQKIIRTSWKRRLIAGLWSAAILLLMTAGTPKLHAQDNTEFDSYRFRVAGFWFYSNPSGDIQGSNETGTIDLNKDLGFSSYSTFSGGVDWRFTRKNHLYLIGSSYDQSRDTVLNRTIVFQGQTFEAGLSTHVQLSAPLIAPGYQYDIIRRRRGHFGLRAQIDLFNASASIAAAAQVTGSGVQQEAVSAKGSLLAPIPVAGPEFRLYLTDSPRLFVEGTVSGMYFFGYGNFISTVDDLGIAINRHLSVNAGYQLGSRLVVNNDAQSNRIGLRLTQSGAVVGLEASF
jgi:hypothetical protein